MSKTRVLLLQDNYLLREGLTAILSQQPDLRVRTVSYSIDCLETAMKFKPNVILLGARLTDQKFPDAIERTIRKFDGVAVIVMDYVPNQGDALEFIRAGASGFILRDATLNQCLKVIRSVARGEKVLPTELTKGLFSQIMRDNEQERVSSRLENSVGITRREREVADSIAREMSNKEIACELNISVSTVKSHVHNILDKLAIRTRMELASLTLSNTAALKLKNKPDIGLLHLDPRDKAIFRSIVGTIQVCIFNVEWVH